MNRIKELRNKDKLSQKELADILFVNQTAVSQWERGATAPGYDFLQRLADYFHVSTDYLLGRTDDPTPSGQKEKPVTEGDELTDEDLKLIENIKSLNPEQRDYFFRSIAAEAERLKNLHK